jgi:uncharacterized protein (DUF58 family)
VTEGAAWLDYRLRGPSRQARPGKHPARETGSGGDACGVRPFWQVPDARRIDLRRSIVDPYGDILVRQTEQRSAMTVVLAVDLSASMAPAADRSVLPGVLALARAAARSALRGGDSFGLVGFDRTVREDVTLAPTRARGPVEAALERLAAAGGHGRGAAGLTALAGHLPSRRCLVLLVSDFAFGLETIEAGLAGLARHDVAPVVLPVERAASLPRRGLLRLRDVETGGTRLVAMRPALRARWMVAEAARDHALAALFLRHGRPGFVSGRVPDLAALSEHLMDA